MEVGVGCGGWGRCGCRWESVWVGELGWLLLGGRGLGGRRYTTVRVGICVRCSLVCELMSSRTPKSAATISNQQYLLTSCCGNVFTHIKSRAALYSKDVRPRCLLIWLIVKIFLSYALAGVRLCAIPYHTMKYTNQEEEQKVVVP